MKIIKRSKSTNPKFASEIIIYEYASGRRVSVFHNIVNERYYIHYVGSEEYSYGPFNSLREAFENLR